MDTIEQAAKVYRDAGIITHPLTSPKSKGASPGKRPILSGWSELTEHPTDADINNYYNLRDNNIGAVCGKNSDLVIIDIDWYIKGMWDVILDGIDTTSWIKQWRTKERWHWLFTYDESVKLMHEKPLGFDLLSNGGNVVMSPSIHESGQTYQLNGNVTDRPTIPEQLVKNINGFVGIFHKLIKTLGTCRRTFLNLFNAVFVDNKHGYYHRLDLFRHADGRSRSLALFAEIKAAGATDEEMILLCMMIFGDNFNMQQSVEALSHIKASATAKTETILSDPILSEFYEKNDRVVDEYKNYYTQEIKKDGTIKVNLCLSSIAEGITKRLNAISFNDDLYVYQNGYYVKGEVQIKSQIQEIAKTVGYKGPLKRHTDEILHYMKYDNPHIEYPFNQYNDMLPVNNGIVKIDFDEQRCDLLPHDPSYLFTYKLPVDYMSDNDGSVIHKNVISQYVEDNDENILYQMPAQAILQALGAAPFKKAYILQGDPNAGKSSYLELLLRCFGKRNISGQSLQSLSESNFSVANLEGKQFNVYDDLSDIPMKDTGVFKTLTGKHDHWVQRKGVQGYETYIHAVHIYTCNSPPTFDKRVKNDTAFWDRWEYTHFPYKFEKDPYYYDKTFTPDNISGFFSRVLKTAIQIKAHGLITNSTASEVREMWSFNSDPLYQFIQESFDTERGSMYIEKDGLIECINKWAIANDVDMEKIPSGKTAMTQALDKYEIYSARPKNADGVQVQAYSIPGVWKMGANFTVQKIIQKTEQSNL